MSFEVAMKALVADADRWQDMGAGLTTMSGNTAGLALDASAFSFAGGDVHAAYEEVRTFVQGLLTDASTEVTGAAAALTYVHATYSGTDQAAKDALDAKWQWL